MVDEQFQEAVAIATSQLETALVTLKLEYALSESLLLAVLLIRPKRNEDRSFTIDHLAARALARWALLDREVYNYATQICAQNTVVGREIPRGLRRFASEVMQGKLKVPPINKADKYAWRNTILIAVVILVAWTTGLKITRSSNPASAKRSAIDATTIAAASLGAGWITYEAVRKLFIGRGKKWRYNRFYQLGYIEGIGLEVFLDRLPFSRGENDIPSDC